MTLEGQMAGSEGNTAAGIISAIASLVSALAWPILVGVLLYAIYRHSDKITENMNRFMEGKSSAKIGLSATGGFTFELVEKTANTSANAVIESAKKSATGPLDLTQTSQVNASAQSAAMSLASNVFDPRKRLKILWVDDHPENNIDLQYAFQALGIIVICVDSNDALSQAFEDVSGFDIVITDMSRDEMGGGRRQAEPEAGLKTVEAVRSYYPDTKVIIYSGNWADAHRGDPLRSPVIQITNYPQDLYKTIVDLAKRKAI